MTGMVPYLARSRTSLCEKTRAVMASKKRDKTRAVSATVSPRFNWSSLEVRFRAWPPNWYMATSNDTLVRVEGFWNIMPRFLPFRADEYFLGFFLMVRAVLRMSSISGVDRSLMASRSRPFRDSFFGITISFSN